MRETTDQKRQFPWDLLGYSFFACLICFVGMLIGTFTVGFGVSAVFMLLANWVPVFTEGVIQTINKFAAFSIVWVILFVYARRVKKSTMTALWFGGEKKKGKSIIMGILIGGVMCALSIGVSVLFGGIRISYYSFEPVILVPVILFGFIQAGAEELAFRGFMLQGLMKKHSVAVSVILNSIFFGVMHFGNRGLTVGAVINIAMLGIVFSLTVVKWNRLSMAMGMHAMWNFTEQIIFGTPNSGNIFERPIFMATNTNTSWFYNQLFGVEAAVQTFVVCAIVIFIFMKVGQNNE